MNEQGTVNDSGMGQKNVVGVAGGLTPPRTQKARLTFIKRAFLMAYFSVRLRRFHHYRCQGREQTAHHQINGDGMPFTAGEIQ